MKKEDIAKKMSFLFKGGKDEHKQYSKKDNKKVLDREEKRLGKIADKNTKVMRDMNIKH